MKNGPSSIVSYRVKKGSDKFSTYDEFKLSLAITSAWCLSLYFVTL